MISHTKKFIFLTFAASMLLAGVAHAADQYAFVTLPVGASYADSDNINGTTNSMYGGWLNGNRGSMKVAAKKVVAYWPDSTVHSFTTATTDATDYYISFSDTASLYYVNLTPVTNAPSGTGYIKNYSD